jgi:hypothetical protein
MSGGARIAGDASDEEDRLPYLKCRALDPALYLQARRRYESVRASCDSRLTPEKTLLRNRPSAPAFKFRITGKMFCDKKRKCRNG